jgi:hypothetical protein
MDIKKRTKTEKGRNRKEIKRGVRMNEGPTDRNTHARENVHVCQTHTCRSNTGVVGSKPARGIDVYVYSVFVLFCV